MNESDLEYGLHSLACGVALTFQNIPIFNTFITVLIIATIYWFFIPKNIIKVSRNINFISSLNYKVLQINFNKEKIIDLKYFFSFS